MLLVGIDPAMRHTGICLRKGADLSFHEVKTGSLPITDAAIFLEDELAAYLINSRIHEEKEVVICMERQLSVGGQTSSLQYLSQVLTLKTLIAHLPTTPTLIAPLPNQLKSYMIKRHALTGKNKSDIVELAKTVSGYTKRMSSHCADAYFLTLLGEEVTAGKWKYNLPSNETPLSSWRIKND